MAEDVRKLDAGKWFSPKYKGTFVPTIAEMLDHLQGKAKVFFDVKRGTPVADLVKLIREKEYTDKSFFGLLMSRCCVNLSRWLLI